MFDSPTQTSVSSTTNKSILGSLEGDSGYASGGAALPVPPVAATPPPMFGAQSSAKRPGRKPGGSFMSGMALTPGPTQLGSNTLMGQ